MKGQYQLLKVHNLTPKEEDKLNQGIQEQAYRLRHLGPILPFGLLIKNSEGQIVGGAKGATYYGCLYIDTLWIDSPLRYQGWGSLLMQASEQIGRQRGCTFATVNTMDWEALPFYLKLGYNVEFVRKGYQAHSKMYLLRKEL